MDSLLGKVGRDNQLFEWVIATFDGIFELVLRPKGSKSFVLLLKRWTTESTGWCRCLNQDDECSCESIEA